MLFLQDSFRIFCFLYLNIAPIYSSRQIKNSVVAEPNVVKDGWGVFVEVEQRFTFLPCIYYLLGVYVQFANCREKPKHL